MISITLSSFELGKAKTIGQRRYATVDRETLQPAFPGATEADQIVGAEGEVAFCKALGLPWPAFVDTFSKVPDVLPNWEVRTSRRLRAIKVATKDPSERLVVGLLKQSSATFEIHGYIRAGGAQQIVPAEDRGNRGKPAHFVPFGSIHMVPIERGFHTTCLYEEDPIWGWSCIVCGGGIWRDDG